MSSSPLMWLVVAFLAAVVLTVAWRHRELERRLKAVSKVVADEWGHLLETRQAVEAQSRQFADLGLERMVERLSGMEGRLDALVAEQRERALRDADLSPYVDAIRAARAGASVEEISTSHELSRAEAELIVALHAGRRDPE